MWGFESERVCRKNRLHQVETNDTPWYATFVTVRCISLGRYYCSLFYYLQQDIRDPCAWGVCCNEIIILFRKMYLCSSSVHHNLRSCSIDMYKHSKSIVYPLETIPKVDLSLYNLHPESRTMSTRDSTMNTLANRREFQQHQETLLFLKQTLVKVDPRFYWLRTV